MIEKAVAGDSDAIERVLDYYASYIDSLCREVKTRPDGTKETVINEDMQELTQEVLTKLQKLTKEEFTSLILEPADEIE